MNDEQREAMGLPPLPAKPRRGRPPGSGSRATRADHQAEHVLAEKIADAADREVMAPDAEPSGDVLTKPCGCGADCAIARGGVLVNGAFCELLAGTSGAGEYEMPDGSTIRIMRLPTVEEARSEHLNREERRRLAQECQHMTACRYAGGSKVCPNCVTSAELTPLPKSPPPRPNFSIGDAVHAYDVDILLWCAAKISAMVPGEIRVDFDDGGQAIVPEHWVLPLPMRGYHYEGQPDGPHGQVGGVMPAGERLGLGLEHMVAEEMHQRDADIMAGRGKGVFGGFTQAERELITDGIMTVKEWLDTPPGSRAGFRSAEKMVDLIERAVKMLGPIL